MDRCFVYVQPGGGPETDPGHAEENYIPLTGWGVGGGGVWASLLRILQL